MKISIAESVWVIILTAVPPWFQPAAGVTESHLPRGSVACHLQRYLFSCDLDMPAGSYACIRTKGDLVGNGVGPRQAQLVQFEALMLLQYAFPLF